MRLPRLPEGFSLRKPAVLALVVVLLGGSAIFGLTADNMRSAPTGTTKAPDIAEFDPVLASFNFRKTAQSSLAMAVSFLRQAQSGAYDIAAVAPRIEQQADAAGEAAAGANRAVDTATDALDAAKREAGANDSPGGATQTTEESEAIRSLEAGVQAAKKYAEDANKFKQGTDKLLAAVKQAQSAQDKQRKDQANQPQQPGLPGKEPTGPVLAAPRPGTGPVVQPPSWLGQGGTPRGPIGPGDGDGDGDGTPPAPPPTTTTKPKPLSPCKSLDELLRASKKLPRNPTVDDGTPGGTEPVRAPRDEGDEGFAPEERDGDLGGLTEAEADAMAKVCKALPAYKAKARKPNAKPTPAIQKLIDAWLKAHQDLQAFSTELNAELQSDPAQPATGFFITEQFVQPAADAQADYELKAGAATNAATASTQASTASTAAAAAAQAAQTAAAANPADQKLAADAAAKKAAADAAKKAADDAKKLADDAKKAADQAKELADDVKKIADEVSSFPGRLTSILTRTRPTLPKDTKLPELDKAEAAWVVLLADLEVKRDEATAARASARVALAAAEQTIADLNALPPDTAPAARDALIQDTGEKVVDVLVAWRAAVEASNAEAEASDMVTLAGQLWGRADAKARGVEPPELPAPPPSITVPVETPSPADDKGKKDDPPANEAGTDPVDPPQAPQPQPGKPIVQNPPAETA